MNHSSVLDSLARRLDCAQVNRADTPSLADDIELDVDEAYAIQALLIGLREERGEKVIGTKLGFTSKAKMAQMGVSEVIVGRLTTAMRIADGDDVDLSRFIHPKIEPEVAYRVGHNFDADDETADVADCVHAVAPAVEIIDSRYRDFRFTYTDVVADNTSAAAFAIGAWQPLQQVDDRAVRLTVGHNEVLGSTSAILGDPARALHALGRVCRERRIPLRAGDVILAGAATAALPLTADVAHCDIAGLGTVTVKGVRP
ncbi:4-oxalocrotonate decarboxylase [Mycobacterium sp. 852013-50091_SCH5140682]|uniref:2-keto-4-pentenoate hydratase n=1 Tax=Mycobacterium sp. 852013-50091_SCH5140682 TaxID=1834109 RepID=UPI0007EC09A2|nr:fumarylacetoacetate hydrolase family protein [Mycobacterium sp. 852013-50091_SCH5140682]OBC09314.1 4-oxalocrotonate decarboxylase [Mycobacterium sp. 852013-50091_SCH5140682]